MENRGGVGQKVKVWISVGRDMRGGARVDEDKGIELPDSQQ